jgi:nucleoside-diphosphate kinase
MQEIRHERTLVLIKPDGVERALVGEILSRLERIGLKIVGLKFVRADRGVLERHYADDETWIRTIGGKTKEAFESYHMDVMQMMGTDDPLAIGRQVREWLIDFMQSAPVVAAVFEGVHAVTVTRKVVGNTLPAFAAPGTIRGDFSADAPTVANAARRPVRNLIHASGTVEEASHEIRLWFAPSELHPYRRADERTMFGDAPA